MGLYEQPNDWTCGPFALKHALVALGKLVDESAIAHVAHPHWWAGTNEVKLARAARAFECDLPFIRRKCPDRAHATLVRHLSLKRPVILCVDDWDHWITVVRHEAGRFVVIDSKNAPVLQVLTWPQLRRRWRFYDETDWGDFVPVFDLHPVKPRFRIDVKAQFSVERAYFLRRQENADLAEHWDDYLSDLLDICRPRTASGRAQPRGHQPAASQLSIRRRDLRHANPSCWARANPRRPVHALGHVGGGWPRHRSDVRRRRRVARDLTRAWRPQLAPQPTKQEQLKHKERQQTCAAA